MMILARARMTRRMMLTTDKDKGWRELREKEEAFSNVDIQT